MGRIHYVFVSQGVADDWLGLATASQSQATQVSTSPVQSRAARYMIISPWTCFFRQRLLALLALSVRLAGLAIPEPVAKTQP